MFGFTTRFRRGALPLLAALVATTAATALGPGGAGAAPNRDPELGRPSEAEHTLARALALFEPSRDRELLGPGSGPVPLEATLVLRDLAAGLDELSPARRVVAQRLLARPTDGRNGDRRYRSRARHTCDARMCFWWVSRGADAPPRLNRNRNRLPDWVETTRAVFRHVWATEVGRMGYRQPRSDIRSRNHGPNGKLDVYLADIGRQQLYGYCNSDDPRNTYAVSAYCVVDNDFTRRQFGPQLYGKRALQGTAAHEFFHAVQAAYDWYEDTWVFESTANWIEDEVYPDINAFDSLSISPVGEDHHDLPLDGWRNDDSLQNSFAYGTWIFWRYLSEHYGRAIVRDVWNRSRGAKYAIKAVEGALAARGTTFGTIFPAFGVANFTPETTYAEGALYLMFEDVGPAPVVHSLTAAAPTVTQPVRMPHISNDYYAFTPGTGLTPTSTLTVAVSAPGVGGAANLIVLRTDGTRTVVPVPISGGAGTVSGVPFGLGVARVVLVLTNAGTRFNRCGRDRRPPFYSCSGFPLDDADYTFSATASP